jgi:hypothetical protein
MDEQGNEKCLLSPGTLQITLCLASHARESLVGEVKIVKLTFYFYLKLLFIR